MKIIISVVPHEQVVQELLDAMARSIDRFSQDRSFDFRLVRVDQFYVPPGYEERYDDACSVWKDSRNPHPPREAMEAVLMRTPGKRDAADDDGALHYGAVLYRAGDFAPGAHWGAQFYLRQWCMRAEPMQFTRLDCREIIDPPHNTPRNEAPMSFDTRGGFWSAPGKADAYWLGWALAMANKGLGLSGDLNHTGEHVIMEEFETYTAGVGTADALAHKSGYDSAFSRRLIRYGWASACFRSVRPSHYQGAGQRLAELFNAIKPPEPPNAG